MKVWLELAVKNVKEIQKQVQTNLKKVDIEGIIKKTSGVQGVKGYADKLPQGTGILESLRNDLKKAASAAEKAQTMPELTDALKKKEAVAQQLKMAEGMGKTASGIGKMAATAGAVLGVLFVIKKATDKIVAQLVKSSPYLQGILSVMGRAWMLFWRPFGDFLGNLLRPLAVALLRLAVKWLKFSRTPAGEVTTKGIAGAGAGALGGAAIGTVVGGILGGPAGALAGAGVGALVGAMVGAIIALIKDAWQGLKNLFTVIKEWLDYFVMKIFGVDMDRVREAVVNFIYVTIPKFFTEDLPTYFQNAVDSLGDFGGWIWEKITSATANVKTLLGETASWIWDKITGGLSNVWDTLEKWASWVWDKVTTPLQNLYSFLAPWAIWLWDRITEPFANLWDILSTIGMWLAGKIQDPLENVYWWLIGIGGWLYDKITGGLSNVKDWMSGIGIYLYNRVTESIKKAFSNFSFGWSWWWSKAYQTGANYVEQTGLAMVHKGEKVVTAPRAESERSGSSIVLSPTFNISGTNGTTSDINSQVRRAARMLEFEVRRRNLL